jgi:hypothetical protein
MLSTPRVDGSTAFCGIRLNANELRVLPLNFELRACPVAGKIHCGLRFGRGLFFWE